MPLTRREALGVVAGVGAGLAAGCSADAIGAARTLPGPEPDARPDLPPVRSPYSLPALMRTTFASPAPERRDLVRSTDRWRSYRVMYPSGDLHISGMLHVPRGAGPFPAVVLAHGYTRPAQYVSGSGMGREQAFLAERGFVVLHTDYRGHGASSGVDDLEMELGLGFAEDALNAAQAVKQMPEVDPTRVAMFGLSMGGGVTCNALVAGPGIVRAAAVWASVSSRFADNYHRLRARRLPERVDAIRRTFGPPSADSTFYADLSSRTFFDRITAPVLLDHGTSDAICPARWSRTTEFHMAEAGVDVRLHQRRREQHIYSRQWHDAMVDTYAFLRRHLEP